MAPRGLDPEMIVNLRDVVERRFSKMSTQFEASLVDRIKDKVRKEFCGCLWSWSLWIQKKVVWSIRRLVGERRGHSKVKEEEVDFVDQFMESDVKPVEKLEAIAEDIPKFVDVGIEICFHDQLVESDIEIAEHLVVDNQVAIGDELHVAEHLVVSNEIIGVVSLACVDGDLHIAIDVEFDVAGMDSLVADLVLDLHDTVDLYIPDLHMFDMAEDLHVLLMGDLNLHVSDLVLELHDVANMEYMFEDIVVVGCDQL